MKIIHSTEEERLFLCELGATRCSLCRLGSHAQQRGRFDSH